MIFIGIDIGTSGIRACAIDNEARLLAMRSCTLALPLAQDQAIEQAPELWWQGVQNTLRDLLRQIDPREVQALCIDGTSGTLLVTDDRGKPLAPALMYNDSRATAEADRINRLAPQDCAARGAASGLARLLYLQSRHPEAAHALHQADWIAGQFCGRFDITDENNALKSGYDLIQQCWPAWFEQLGINNRLLPQVYLPGDTFGCITPGRAAEFGLPAHTRIIAGTTDSIAAFLATGASRPGEAVTSLGSTLVLKIISDKPVSAPESGIYSHRLPDMSHSDTRLSSPMVMPGMGEGTGDYWLAGGASNSGGAVLRQFFSNDQMQDMTGKLNPTQPTGLDYYPLPRPGERFPVNDPGLQPRLTPRPDDDVVFFQGLLESMARIEQQGYDKLLQLGATPLRRVLTAGGGSRNPAWTQIRQQRLGVPVTTAANIEACYGSALLARRGYSREKLSG